MAEPRLERRRQQVAALLDEHLHTWPEALRSAAHRMWDDYSAYVGELTRKPSTYAASVAYILSRAAHLGETQKAIASRFSSSAGAIGRTCPEMLAALEDLHREDAAVHAAATVARRIGERGGELAGPDIAISAEASALIEGLTSSADEWMLTIRRSPQWILGPEPFRPLLVLLMVGAGSRVGVVKALEPSDDAGPHVVQILLDYIISCGYRPGCLVCDTAAFGMRVIDSLGDCGVAVAMGHTNELDDAFASLAAFSDDDSSEIPDTALRPGVSPRVVAGFHDACARLARVSPWDLLPESAVLSIQVDRCGYDTATVVVIGGLGIDRGFITFASARDYTDFERITGTPVAQMAGPGVRLLTVSFEAATDLAPERRREAMANGWEVVAPDRYPVMRDIDYDRVERPVTDDAYALLTAVAHAIAAVCELFEETTPTAAIELTVEIPNDAPVVLRLPHPEL